MTQSFQSSRVSIPGTISTNGFVWSYRTRAPIGLISDGLRTRNSRASALYCQSTAASSRDGRLAERRKRGGPFGASLSAIFPTRRDMWSGIIKFLRAVQAPGSLVLRAFVQHPQKSDGRFFVGFQFSPAFRSSVAAHIPNMKQKDARSHEQCTREYE